MGKLSSSKSRLPFKMSSSECKDFDPMRRSGGGTKSLADHVRRAKRCFLPILDAL